MYNNKLYFGLIKNMLFYRIILPIMAFSLFFSVSCVKDSDSSHTEDSLSIAKVYKYDGLTGKDATVESLYADSCFKDAPYFTVFSWTNGGIINKARSFIYFDISNVPQNTIVKAAKLSFYWINYENLTNHTGDNSFTIYRVTSAWDENTLTWNTQPTTSDLNKINVPKSKTINQSYTDIDVTKIVQEMINNPTDNHGFMLKLNEEIPYRLVILGSSDYPDVSKSPKLVVYY